MSTISNALVALKNVVLMQERLDVIRKDMDRITTDMAGLNDYVVSVDRRVVRIETMIEMTTPPGSRPRLEGS